MEEEGIDIDPLIDPEIKQEHKNILNARSGKPDDSLKSQKEEQSLETVITLKDIDFKVKKGEFVCIIGDVGSGKSSLLSTLVGDMLLASTNLVD